MKRMQAGCFASLLLLELIVIGLAGCKTPGQTVAAQVAVMLATDRVVQGHPDRAEKAIAIADEVSQLAAGDTSATVGAVVALVRARIDWTKLNPNEVTAVNLLLAAVEAELQARVAKAEIPPDLRLQVATVAAWIKQAAEPYRGEPLVNASAGGTLGAN